MGLLPKILFALMLLLPGGFVIGPVIFALKRWRERQGQQAHGTQLIAAQLPRESPSIESTRIAV